MQAIGGFTKIHGNGNGGFEVVINGIKDAEIAHQRALAQQEIEHIQNVCAREIADMRKRLDKADERHNKELAQKLVAIRARVYPERNKVKEFFGFLIGCIYCYLEKAKWVVYDPIKKECEEK